MKIILSLIISGALVVSGFGQTRNVLVGTNNTVVQPTNFWSADASNARSGLGLGSAATNPASAFQPSSSALSNIVSGDGSSLSNLAASNIVGILTLSRGGTSATNAESARSSLGLSFSALTNTNAVNFRSAILPSYSGNTNKVLAVNSNGTDIEWVTQTGGGSITSGIIAITNGGTGATNAAQARTNLGLGATNVVQFRRLEVLSGTNASIWLQDESRIEGDGVLYISGQLIFESPIEFQYNDTLTPATTRTNLGLGATWLTNTNVTNFRTAIGLGATNNVAFKNVIAESFRETDDESYISFQDEFLRLYADGAVVFDSPASFSGLNTNAAATTRTNLGLPLPALTNTNNASFIQAVLPSYTGNQSKVLALNSSANGLEWVAGGSGLAIPIAIVNGGTGATNAETARTNLGLGAAWLTNTVLTNFRTDIGLGTANAVTFGSANILGVLSVTGAVTFGEPAQTRTNLDLSLIALTNTNNANFRTAIELGPNNNVKFDTLALYALYKEASTNLSINVTDLYLANTSAFSGSALNWGGSNSVLLGLPLSFGTNTHAAITRTNLGVPSSFGSGTNSAIGGGLLNTASGIGSFVGGGLGNDASGQNSTVVGGDSGLASGQGSVVVGGYQNFATGSFSFAAGNKARATNSGSFVWADNQNNLASTFSSVANDSFNVRASGGSYFNEGTFYVYKTNVGPFEGLLNVLNSNNTTLSNETLFRVGLAEATNRSAQFGFRVARTNNGGEGFAVFSVFGYNALMMIGPSDRSRSNSITNTNAAIEADIYSISTTNKVMTLITTNTGAMQMHRPIGFNTNASAPTNTTNVVGWIEFYVGTNSVRVPYYQ
jgi:hypothetical protein